MNVSPLKMSHLNLGFWHFSPVYVLLKVTYPVTLFDRKPSGFQKVAKVGIFH